MLTLALLSLALPCAAPPTCTCLRGPALTSKTAIATEVGRVAAVFEGRIVGVEFEDDSVPPTDARNPTGRWYPWTDRVARVVVVRQWKGDLPDTVFVHTSSQVTMCGANLVEGRRYLFFAGSHEYSGLGEDPPATAATKLETSSCDLTREWDAEARRLARLLGSARGQS